MSSNEKTNWKRSYHGRRPPHWATFFVPSHLARSFLRHLRKDVSGVKLLEIGCGNGRDTCFFSEAGYRCVGIDISPQAIALARAQRPKGNSARFRVADAEKLPFADGSFDGVYSIGVLHSTRLERSLKEIFRVLKPGGIAMLHFWQKTMYLDRKKEKVHCVPEHLKEVLRGLPVRVLRFRSDIQGKHVDTDRRGVNRHKHVAIIVLLQRPPNTNIKKKPC